MVHTVVGTAGNVADVTKAHALLHCDEIAALGDAGQLVTLFGFANFVLAGRRLTITDSRRPS